VYPLVSLATVQVLTARIGRSEKLPARVAISGPRPLADKLRARLAARNHAGNDDFALSPAAATDADAAGAPSAHILFDETQERSRTARTRIEEALAATAEPGCAAPYAITVEG